MTSKTFAAPLDLTSAHAELRARFWAKVARRGPDDCWEWTAYRKPGGYGQFVLRKGRFITASRVALALTLGRPISAGEVACHRCDNPPCCNPAHLFVGTQVDNSNDCVEKGRKNSARGERQGAAKLAERDVRAILAEPHYYGVARSLGRRYGVSDSVIRRIRQRTLWAYLDTPTNTDRMCTKGHLLAGDNVLGSPDPSARTECATCAEVFRAGRHVANRRTS